MEIYLVRHTSVDVPSGYVYGQTDVPLRETFEEEAKEVKATLDQFTFDAVWSSPLSRCTRLAKYCGYQDAILEDRIKEINFGDWEMKTWDEVNEDPHSEDWFENWLNTPTPNGESSSDQYERVSQFLDEVRASGHERVCIFAHGGVLACSLVYIGQYNIQEAFKNIPPYGEIIRLICND
jgi:alpha-ribazole phosphatase